MGKISEHPSLPSLPYLFPSSNPELGIGIVKLKIKFVFIPIGAAYCTLYIHLPHASKFKPRITRPQLEGKPGVMTSRFAVHDQKRNLI